QVGFAILFQTVSQNNQAPWTTIDDIMVRNNLIKNSTQGANLLDRFNSVPTNGTRRVAFVNNVFQDVGRDPNTGQKGAVFQLLGAVQDIAMVNNTATASWGDVAKAVYFDGPAGLRTVIVNNVFPVTAYGIGGSGTGVGTATLAKFAPGAVVAGNVLPLQASKNYPASNFFPVAGAPVLFVNAAGGNFSLTSANSFYSGALGLVGVNGANMSAQTAGVAW
ncbi:MAG: hypothetical protein H7Z40_10225, partial [Phycisphaerae bacterium]|nr:hypothetical protein [Gemmatimonadaceae bacterium]